MATARDIRRCAFQALFQLDLSASTDLRGLMESLADSPGGEDAHRAGSELALAAWEARRTADTALGPFTLEWPVHRQPGVDRAILRLAHFEMTSGRTPPKVVINESVELAKEFSTEKSPMFINGVLDRLYRATRPAEAAAGASTCIAGDE